MMSWFKKRMRLIKVVLNSYTKTQDEWIKQFEDDPNNINSMRDIQSSINAFNICINHVKDNSKVLSIGCGPGREVISLKNKGCEVTALDNSEYMISQSKIVAPNVEYILHDATTFTRPNTYDYVTCLFSTINAFENVKDRKRFVKNCYDSLKNGGVLLINTASRNANWKVYLRSVLVKKNYYYKTKQIDEWFEGTDFKYEKIRFNSEYIIVANK